MDDLIVRLLRASKRMADLTADRRAPMISIPPSSDDDDMLICGACKDAADELDRLRRELADVADALPNTARYLDPPDGGDVPIAEQVRRMGRDLAEAQEDADTYRQERDDISGNYQRLEQRSLELVRGGANLLREQGEARELLREARDALPTKSDYESRVEYLKSLRTRIDAALTPSPSAPPPAPDTALPR